MEQYHYSMYSKKAVDPVAHVTIKQIMDCQDDSLKIGNTEISCVCIVGIVRNVNELEKKIVYSVEDNTGEIEVIQWLNEDEGAGEKVFKDKYYKVFGKMGMQNDKKVILTFSIKPVTDLKIITVHKLEVVYTVLKLKQLQQKTEQNSMNESSPDQMELENVACNPQL